MNHPTAAGCSRSLLEMPRLDHVQAHEIKQRMKSSAARDHFDKRRGGGEADGVTDGVGKQFTLLTFQISVSVYLSLALASLPSCIDPVLQLTSFVGARLYLRSVQL